MQRSEGQGLQAEGTMCACKGPEAGMSLDSRGTKGFVRPERREQSRVRSKENDLTSGCGAGGAGVSGFSGVTRAMRSPREMYKGPRRSDVTLRQSLCLRCGKSAVKETATSHKACRGPLRYRRLQVLGPWWWPWRRTELGRFWMRFGDRASRSC